MPSKVVSDKLIDEARRIGNHKTPEQAITAALQEYVRRRKRLRILELFGTIDFDPTYDYKAARRRDAEKGNGRGGRQ